MISNQNEFSVTLVSNSSYDVCPENTVFNFTNILARELIFPQQEKWKMCLSSITVSNIAELVGDEIIKRELAGLEEEFIVMQKRHDNFNRALARGKDATKTAILQKGFRKESYFMYRRIVKKRIELFNKKNPFFVECDQITPKYDTSKILASFVAPPHSESKNEFITYQPSTEEYFELNSTRLNRFDIKIVSPEGTELQSTIAQPTVVVLKFKKMEYEIYDTHTIHVSNKMQNPANFLVNFPDSLVPDGAQNPWEIAVSRISLIPLFKKFPGGEFNIQIVRRAEDFPSKFNVNTWNDYLADKEVGNITFTYQQDNTEEDFVPYISTVLAAAGKKVLVKAALRQDPDGKVKIRAIVKDATARETLLIILPTELICVLGLDSEGIIYRGGVGALPTTTSKIITGRRKLQLDFLYPQNLLLYSDCVMPSLIGNVYGQYLTHLPIPKNEKKEGEDALQVPYFTHEPKNLEFHPIRTAELNNVRFKMLKTDGSEPVFDLRSIEMFISLIFRRRIK